MLPPALEEIQRLAERILQAEGMELVDIEFRSGQARNLLRIFIDKTGGITLSDCENISRQMSAVLDVKDLLRDSYVLEVSSPGLDRLLKTDRDYQRAFGRMVRVGVLNQNARIDTFVGKLAEFNDLELILESNGKRTRIARDKVRKAQQEIMFGQPKKNQARRK